MPGPEQSEAFVGRQQEEESLLSRPSPAVLALRALLGVHCSSLDCQDDLAPSSSGGEHPTVVKPDHPIKLSHAQQVLLTTHLACAEAQSGAAIN
eukprot:1154628-Pelagomonas_calceolata.AAC.5